MAVLVRTCCCGCDLRTGVLLIAIFGLLASGYGIYSSYHSVKTLTDLKGEAKELSDEGLLPVSYKFYKVVINLCYASIAFHVLQLLANVMLLGSYGTMNRFLTLPYIILHIFLLAYTLGVTIFFIAVWHGFSYLYVGTIINWLLLIYFILVVYSYHESLREDPSGSEFSAPRQMVQVAGPPPYAKFP